MITAINQHGTTVSLSEKMSKDHLISLKKDFTFYCPGCKLQVLIKAGSIKIPHFAHLNNSACSVSSEPESEYHLLGKIKIFQWLQLQKLNAVLEAYIPEVNQRADILVKIGSRTYAVEFQCSVIPEHDFCKRTEAYIQQNITPIWILASKLIKEIKQNEHYFSAFQWLFLTGQRKKPVLLAFCPYKQHIFQYNHFFPYTKRKTFAFKNILPMRHSSFQSLLCDRPRFFPFLSQWRKHRLTWNIHSVKTKTIHDPFFKELYLNRISPAYLPVEIGIPITGMYLLESPAVEWQAWLFLDVLHNKTIGSSISINECKMAIRNRIELGLIKTRKLPQLGPDDDYFYPVCQYIRLLLQAGYLQNGTEGKITIKKKFRIPETTAEWIELEKEFYFKNQKLFLNLVQ
jgi:competence protein CoiA